MLTFHLDWVQVLGLLVSTILPIIVALATNWKIDARVKAVLLAALSAVTGLGTEVLQALTEHTAYDLGRGLLGTLTAFLIATAMYFGLWKPTGLTSSGNGLLSGARADATPTTASSSRTVHIEPGGIVVTNVPVDTYHGEAIPLATKSDVTDEPAN